jgi:predicted ATP-grasp superfamily ATP-dependent carboligase
LPTCTPFEIPPIADVPWPGTAIDTLEPIMSIFATGADAASCEAQLDRIEARWMDRLMRNRGGS